MVRARKKGGIVPTWARMSRWTTTPQTPFLSRVHTGADSPHTVHYRHRTGVTPKTEPLSALPYPSPVTEAVDVSRCRAATAFSKVSPAFQPFRSAMA